MPNEPFSLRRSLLVACLGGMTLLLPAAAFAQQAQDDDDTFEQKIIKNILGGMGVNVGQPGIDYRERSPLVIPPTRDLPLPQASAASAPTPAWPHDPDRKIAVRSSNRPNARATPEDPGTESALSPDELRRGTNPRAPRVTDPSQTTGSLEDYSAGNAVSPSKLGSSSIFNWNALMGTHLNEQAQFTGEPTRGSLTQPPAGYQTPSPNYAYGAGVDKGSGWKIPNILDRAVGRE